MWGQLDEETRKRNAERLARYIAEHKRRRREDQLWEEEFRRRQAEEEARYRALSPRQRLAWHVTRLLKGALLVLGSLILAAGLILTGNTMQRLAGQDMMDAQVEGQAMISSCVRRGPITPGQGFGYWETCTATIIWEGYGQERVSVDAVFTSADIGTSVRVGDVNDDPRDRKLARADVAARPWLTRISYVLFGIAAVPILFVGLFLGLYSWALLAGRNRGTAGDGGGVAPDLPDEWPFVDRDQSATPAAGAGAAAAASRTPSAETIAAANRAAAAETVTAAETVIAANDAATANGVTATIQHDQYEGPVVRSAPSTPLAVIASTMLFAGLWIANLISGGYLPPDGGLKEAVYPALFTLVLAATLVAVWRGRSSAVSAMSYLGIVGGSLVVAMTAVLSLVVFIYRHALGALRPQEVVPGLAAGAALLIAGWLLRRPSVRDWLVHRRR